MVRLICGLILVLAITTPSMGQQSLVGTYKIVSFIEEMEGKTVENMGKFPHGYLIFTPTHVLAFYTTKERKPGTSMAEKAELFDSLVGWSGAYRLEGSKLVFSVDVSWNEIWNGKDQIRNFQLSGNRLTLTSDPQPWARDPSKTIVIRQVWEKVE